MITASAGEAFHTTIEEFVFQTDDATPVLARAFPIGVEKVARVDIMAECHALDMSAGAAADFIAMFARRTGANLVKFAQRTELIVTTFAAPQPALTINANASTQSIEIVLTGKAQILRWHVSVAIRETA